MVMVGTKTLKSSSGTALLGLAMGSCDFASVMTHGTVKANNNKRPLRVNRSTVHTCG